jgi:hypothetical protein
MSVSILALAAQRLFTADSKNCTPINTADVASIAF